MQIKNAVEILSSEITPKNIYINRRKFLAGVSAAGAALVAGRSLLQLVSPAEVLAGC